MKCSALANLLASLMMIAAYAPATAGAKGTASSKPTSQQELKSELDLIQLETQNETKPKPPKARPTKPKPPAAFSIDNIQLDDIKLDETPIKKAPSAAEAASTQADALEKAKDFNGVIKLLKPSLETLPRKDLLQIARAYKAVGDFTNEAHALELVVAKNPKDYVSQTLLGNAYLEAKRYDVAGTSFQAARAINNRYRPAYDGQWALLEKDDSKYEARTLVLDMIKTFGPDPKTSSALCKMYSVEDFLEKATEACRSAIEIDKKNPANYVYLAMSLRDQEHKPEADKLITDAAKRFPSSEEVQVLAGEMKIGDKNFAEAYKLYKQATVANPKSARAQSGFATSAFQLQKHTEAIEAFKTACRLDRKTGRDFRAASIQLKTNKDPKWMLYQTGLEACE